MANFIRDIRADLGRPNLPFVIATTGMDGRQGHGYTQVERAQLRMADATAYPDFVGNVTVIDARATYEGLDFWQPIPFSPSPGGTQGFHWNRSAKTYLHLGLAMGDAMNLLAPGRTPYRLRSSGGSGGTILTWQNGMRLTWKNQLAYSGIEVRREGALLATLAGASTTFTDPAPPAGPNSYTVTPTNPGSPTSQVAVNVTAAPRGTAIFYEPFDMPAGVQLPGQPAGIGMVLLNNNTITYTGPTAVNGGSFLDFGGLPSANIGGGSVELVGAKTYTGDTVIRSGGRLGLAAISGGGGVALGLQNSVLDVGSAGGNSTLTKTGLGTQTLSGIDRVEVKIRRTLAENGKLFARLKVLVAP